MKLWIMLILALSLSLTLCACAREMPQAFPNDAHAGEEAILVTEPDVIDSSLFDVAENLICNPYHRVFRNIPGMVLHTNRAYGDRLFYINKKTGESRLFCFDPLCDHQSCMATINPYAQYYVWSSADGCLYAAGYDVMTGGNDGCLYRIDTTTQESALVITGNGNEWRQMLANEQYIFLLRAQKDGSLEILRFDPIGKRCDTISPPDGKAFSDLMVSGNTCLVSFMDEPTSYLTDCDFAAYTPTALSSRVIYLDGATAYVASDEQGHDVGRVNTARCLDRYDLNTGTRTRLLSVDGAAFDPVGFDGSYIYYLLNPLKEGTADRLEEYGDILYRISVMGGEGEPLVNFDQEHTGLNGELYVYEACCYDGVIYCNVRSESREDAAAPFGTITQNADGSWVFQAVGVR